MDERDMLWSLEYLGMNLRVSLIALDAIKVKMYVPGIDKQVKASSNMAAWSIY